MLQVKIEWGCYLLVNHEEETICHTVLLLLTNRCPNFETCIVDRSSDKRLEEHRFRYKLDDEKKYKANIVGCA